MCLMFILKLIKQPHEAVPEPARLIRSPGYPQPHGVPARTSGSEWQAEAMTSWQEGDPVLTCQSDGPVTRAWLLFRYGLCSCGVFEGCLKGSQGGRGAFWKLSHRRDNPPRFQVRQMLQVFECVVFVDICGPTKRS